MTDCGRFADGDEPVPALQYQRGSHLLPSCACGRGGGGKGSAVALLASALLWARLGELLGLDLGWKRINVCRAHSPKENLALVCQYAPSDVFAKLLAACLGK